MIEVKFYLREDKKRKDGKMPLMARVAYDYKTYKKLLPITLKKGDWSRKTQRVLSSEEKQAELNDYLDKYRSEFNSYIRDCSANEIPISGELIKKYLAGEKHSFNKEIPFSKAYNEYLENHIKVKFATSTYRSHTEAFNYLKDFQEYQKKIITFEGINYDLFERLMNYAYTVRKNSTSTFAKLIRRYHAFINWCINKGYYDGNGHRKWKVEEKEDNNIIYLTWEELMSLYNHTFERQSYNEVKDFYCFSCFTGLRFSDILQLTKDDIYTAKIEGEKTIFLKKRIEKTEEFSNIPLNKYAIEIINKYSYLPELILPKYAEGTINRYIKKCCEGVDINKPTKITKNIGGSKKEKKLPKYKLITMHTGRKTFITNSLELNMNPEAIKGITGHKDDRSFRRYKVITDKLKAQELSKAWDKNIDK